MRLGYANSDVLTNSVPQPHHTFDGLLNWLREQTQILPKETLEYLNGVHAALHEMELQYIGRIVLTCTYIAGTLEKVVHGAELDERWLGERPCKNPPRHHRSRHEP